MSESSLNVKTTRSQREDGGSTPALSHQPKQTFFDFREIERDKPYLELIEDSGQQRVFDQIVKFHHSYVPGVRYGGRRVNWLIRGKKSREIFGAIGVGSAIIAMAARDKFIMWDKETRLSHLINIANNWRYCLLPHAPKNFGSATLGLLAKLAPKEWEAKYHDRLVLLETLVEPPHKGTIYKAAGWKLLGLTKGTRFKWIKRSEADKYIRDGWQVVQKYMKYGKKIDKTKWQVADVGGTTRKRVFIKPLAPDWWKHLMRRDISISMLKSSKKKG